MCNQQTIKHCGTSCQSASYSGLDSGRQTNIGQGCLCI